MIKEIEMLNRRIDSLMTEKTKCDGQREVWQNRLYESIEAYKNEYGVDLSGVDLADIKAKVLNESKIVEAKVRSEYELASKLVSMIDRGDIKGAWDLINAKAGNVTSVAEEPQGVSNSEVEELDDADFFGSGVVNSIPEPLINQRIEEVIEREEAGVVKEPVQTVTRPRPSLSEVMSLGGEPINTREESIEHHTETRSFGTPEGQAFSFIGEFEDDEEEDEFVIPNNSKSESSLVMEDDENDFIIQNTSNSNNGLVMEDDEDDDISFGGFSNILKGSKFEV